jgi:UDP-N-acetyl-D-mannosaminuronate dehydrogenase
VIGFDIDVSWRYRRSCCTNFRTRIKDELRYGFYIGYSPERINPGDEAHTLDKITKIVAGMDEELAIIFYPPYRYTKVNLYYIL